MNNGFMKYVPYIILFVIAVIVILLLRWFINYEAYGKEESAERKKKKYVEEKSAKGLLVNCPVCKSPLLPGEDLYSKIYRPMNVSDQLITIDGCPYCYPALKNGAKRICPVCHKNIPMDGHLTARLFNKAAGKKHVIVTGCTECAKHSPQ